MSIDETHDPTACPFCRAPTALLEPNPDPLEVVEREGWRRVWFCNRCGRTVHVRDVVRWKPREVSA